MLVPVKFHTWDRVRIFTESSGWVSPLWRSTLRFLATWTGSTAWSNLSRMDTRKVICSRWFSVSREERGARGNSATCSGSSLSGPARTTDPGARSSSSGAWSRAPALPSLFFKRGFCYVAQAGLELLIFLSLLTAGITHIYHQSQQLIHFLINIS
jgi:hypothetical protein